MSNGVEIKNISKRYGPDASSPLTVKGISFEIQKGSLTTILGPSGCGKTTTLRMIAGLESPTSGQIIMGGKDVTTLGPADRNVSMMFQSYALFPHMNVVENVMYGLKMSGIAKDAARSRAGDALKNVGLVGFDQRLPSELGGQQQRVALARALVLEPGRSARREQAFPRGWRKRLIWAAITSTTLTPSWGPSLWYRRI